MRAKIINFGSKHGRWTVIGEVFGMSPRRVVCQCSCGTVSFVVLDSLKVSRSCGCLRREVSQSPKVHGYARQGKKHPLYTVWLNMKARCERPSATHFKHYGGRGISVCARWSSSFAAFLEDMGTPASGLTLDRINPDGNYELSNCRWATRKTQSQNRRNVISSTALEQPAV